MFNEGAGVTWKTHVPACHNHYFLIMFFQGAGVTRTTHMSPLVISHYFLIMFSRARCHSDNSHVPACNKYQLGFPLKYITALFTNMRIL